jgi:hypothetical protein
MFQEMSINLVNQLKDIKSSHNLRAIQHFTMNNKKLLINRHFLRPLPISRILGRIWLFSKSKSQNKFQLFP